MQLSENMQLSKYTMYNQFCLYVTAFCKHNLIVTAFFVKFIILKLKGNCSAVNLESFFILHSYVLLECTTSSIHSIVI